ncbi:hypothetical protein C2E23DRAFT_857492 [Lenzites betulinus]|nr:hypothetical protein C2E23DRAFT_857492 [Lenzites betulinus]
MVEALRRENGELKTHVDTLSTQMAAVLEGLGVYDSSAATASSQHSQAVVGDQPGDARALQDPSSNGMAPDITCQYAVDGAQFGAGIRRRVDAPPCMGWSRGRVSAKRAQAPARRGSAETFLVGRTAPDISFSAGNTPAELESLASHFQS